MRALLNEKLKEKLSETLPRLHLDMIDEFRKIRSRTTLDRTRESARWYGIGAAWWYR